MSLSTTQIEALSDKLNVAAVKQRSQNGMNLSYIEGHHAIREANRIFGFDGWTRETVELNLVQAEQIDGKWRIAYTSKCQIRVGEVLRHGVGFGQGIDKDQGRAHESAIKEAETDAMKRALMTFGDPFGLALYDKDQANVDRDKKEPVPAKDRKGKPDKTAPFGWLMSALDPGDWQIKTVSDKQAKFYWEQCALHGLATEETAAFRSYVCRAYELPAEIINKAGGYSFGIEFLKDAHDDCILKAIEETRKALADKKASKEAA